MRKFLKYSKLALLIWGAVSLGFVLFVAGMIAFQQISKSTSVQQQRDEVREPTLQKRFGDLQLRIMADKQGALLLSLFRAEHAVVTDYKLPAGDYRLYDAEVVPLADSAYRVMLYSNDAESTDGHIWLLKFDGKMRLVKTIPLSDPHQLDEKKTQMFGNTSIVLPGISDSDDYETMAVPTRISIGDEIRIVPLLNAQDLGALNAYFEKRIAARMAKLDAPKNAEMLALYKRAVIEFKENLTSRSIPY